MGGGGGGSENRVPFWGNLGYKMGTPVPLFGEIPKWGLRSWSVRVFGVWGFKVWATGGMRTPLECSDQRVRTRSIPEFLNM